ncbi:MAG: PD-(D/E)XK nuclease family protein [Anaplasma ovis]
MFVTLKFMNAKVFTVHCSESFVETVSHYAISHKADLVIVPSITDAQSFSHEVSKLAIHGAGPEVLAFTSISGCASTAYDTAMGAAGQLLLLAQFVEQWNVIHRADYPLQLANELSVLLDELHVNCVEPNVPQGPNREEFFGHGRVIDLLCDLVPWWERECKNRAIAPPGYGISSLVESLARSGKKVIVAGVLFGKVFTRFLRLLMRSVPDAIIVLPYVDLGLSVDEWRALNSRHYQYYLMQLLRDLGVDRNEVKNLGRTKANYVVERLFNFELASYMAVNNGTESTEGIELVVCSSEAEEAVKVVEILKLCGAEINCGVQANSSYMGERAASVKPTQTVISVDKDAIRSLDGKHITFIGSDSLAARVDALSRVGMNYCDYDEIISTLILCSIEVVISSGNAVQLLCMLKHALVRFGYDADEYHKLLTEFETGVIREHSATGFEAIGSVIKEDFQQLEEFWCKIIGAISPMIAVCGGSTIAEVAAAHIQCLKRLMGKPATSECAHALNRMTQFFSLFDNYCTGAGVFSLMSYKEVCTLLVRAFFVAERNKLFEINLTTRDTVILSGFSEAEFKPRCSYLLNDWVRERLRLPLLEEYCGRMMYVLYSFFYAKKLWITKSIKSFGAAVAEPIWMRYLTFLLRDCTARCATTQTVNGSVAATSPYCASFPNPGLDIRRKAMSVLTAKAVDTLINNPYVFYIRYILKMFPIKAVDTQHLARDFNAVVHRILREYLVSVRAEEGDYDLLLGIARRQFDVIAVTHPYADVLWWPKFKEMAHSFFEIDSERRSVATCIETGKNFVWHVSEGMQVTTRCDRVEHLRDGSVMVVCHKIGAAPSKTDIRCGFASRAIVDAVCVAESTGADIVSFAYWKITPGAVEVVQLEDFAEVVTTAKRGFKELLLRYAEQMTPFSPRDEDFSDFSAYKLLSRIRGGVLHPNAEV